MSLLRPGGAMSVFIGWMGFVLFSVADVKRDYPGGIEAFSQRDDLPRNFCHDGRIGLWDMFMPNGMADPGLEDMRAFGIDASWPRVQIAAVAEGPLNGGCQAWLKGDDPGGLVVPRSLRTSLPASRDKRPERGGRTRADHDWRPSSHGFWP
ncbi:hypothetical protein E8D34_08715 [Nocardioides sp. GY 10113]|uniref:hypothetical protein n=1 Tax=Nocardioides sp. GY 10113 TaxID=2569761 RepID=UPI0010A8DD3C|nr:hypothetical protein [Nocardioides sp. GY 10113]TIC87745.1 hypothetical protein E8D34_08715 [Nocardioides sp. GY 10113]